VAALILVALLYGGLRAYTGYVGRRATSLLDEAARIQVGATEGSILRFVTRYGEQKWTLPSPENTDDCPNKAACEYQSAHIPEYVYEV
jgi:hypothetical protein